MAKKEKKISFRPGDARSNKIEEYQEKYKRKNSKELKNTDFMILAIDYFLEYNRDPMAEKIYECESKLIEVLTGYSMKDFVDRDEYLLKLQEKLNMIKETTK